MPNLLHLWVKLLLTIETECPQCHCKVDAVDSGDGTYAYYCGNAGCSRHNLRQRVILNDCPHCGQTGVAYEQERPPKSRLPELFLQTCTNPGCKRRGFTLSVELPQRRQPR